MSALISQLVPSENSHVPVFSVETVHSCASQKSSSKLITPLFPRYSSKVNPLSIISLATLTSQTYLKCHGSYPYPVISSLPSRYLRMNP
jgi:hypothetical protein